MTNDDLAKNYFRKVRARIKALHTLLNEESYSDVVRESQEAHELLLKGALRFVGIDPPRWHDVAPIMAENQERFPKGVTLHLKRIADGSKKLRKERELSFYGDEDFLPDESYDVSEAKKWLQEVEWLYALLMAEFPHD